MRITMNYNALRNTWLDLNQSTDFQSKILSESDIRNACILAKTQLSSQAAAPTLERWIKSHLNIAQPVDETSGDGVYQGDNVEIKVSLGGKSGQFNFVQIRPDHDVQAYLFLTYSIWKDEITWFMIPSEELYALIPDFGGYAHGTIKALGKITHDNIKGRNCEYALRPDPHKASGKAKDLWDQLSTWKWTPPTQGEL